MKKWMLVIMALTVFFAFSGAPGTVDAKPRGGSYVSPKKSFSPTTPSSPTKQSNISKTESPKSNTTTSGTAAPTTNRGFFGGGSFMKGMLLGGLAGMLFGGLLGDMGWLGNILGLLVNVMAIFFLIMIIRSIFTYFMEKRNKKRYQQ